MCTAKGKQYPLGTPFSFMDGCYEYNCDCQQDGSWDCPAERARNRCHHTVDQHIEPEQGNKTRFLLSFLSSCLCTNDDNLSGRVEICLLPKNFYKCIKKNRNFLNRIITTDERSVFIIMNQRRNFYEAAMCTSFKNRIPRLRKQCWRLNLESCNFLSAFLYAFCTFLIKYVAIKEHESVLAN